MPFERPSLETLVARIQTDIETRLPGVDARLRRTVERAVAYALGGASHGLHGHLAWLARQLFPDTAEDEYLDRWASIWLGENPRKPAVKAEGPFTAAGTDGSVIEADAQWRRSDGATFSVVDEATIAAGTAALTIRADEPGAAGNTDAGTTLSLVSPIEGVDSEGVVASGGLVDGVERESNTALQARVLARIQKPPKGGGIGDYEAWALEVSGVTRAWEFPGLLGLGTVSLYFVTDDEAGGPIPSASKVTAVQAYLDAKAPVTAKVYAFAPVALPVDYELPVTPATTAVRTAVEAEIADLFRREAEPGGTLLISHQREAISLAAGETDHTLTTPTADTAAGTGVLPVVGAFSWV